VFVEKQEKADMLFKDLLKTSYPCLSLHGGKIHTLLHKISMTPMCGPIGKSTVT